MKKEKRRDDPGIYSERKIGQEREKEIEKERIRERRENVLRNRITDGTNREEVKKQSSLIVPAK